MAASGPGPAAAGERDVSGNNCMSRLEARMALELAIEARFPRLIPKKPLYAGSPIGAN